MLTLVTSVIILEVYERAYLPTNYEKVFLMWDFNAEESNSQIKYFCNLYKLNT